MKFELLERVYSVSLTNDEMLKLHRIDNEKGFGEPCLFNLLEKLDGVRDINYDLHFGAYVFIKVEVAHDTKEFKANVLKIIKDFIKE